MSGTRTNSTRRDAIFLLATSFAGVGGLAALWPFIAQMNPNGSSPRDDLVVDLSTFDADQLKIVQWKREPILIRRRTPEEITAARNVDVASLIDPRARVAGLGAKSIASDDNRTKAGYREWLVAVGACTRCGCLLKDGRGLGFDTVEAFFCACCASRFDLAGRVRAGPAPTNLAVPPYVFMAPAKLAIGTSS